jgi:hypothetical protein
MSAKEQLSGMHDVAAHGDLEVDVRGSAKLGRGGHRRAHQSSSPLDWMSEGMRDRQEQRNSAY